MDHPILGIVSVMIIVLIVVFLRYNSKPPHKEHFLIGRELHQTDYPARKRLDSHYKLLHNHVDNNRKYDVSDKMIVKPSKSYHSQHLDTFYKPLHHISHSHATEEEEEEEEEEENQYKHHYTSSNTVAPETHHHVSEHEAHYQAPEHTAAPETHHHVSEHEAHYQAPEHTAAPETHHHISEHEAHYQAPEHTAAPEEHHYASEPEAPKDDQETLQPESGDQSESRPIPIDKQVCFNKAYRCPTHIKDEYGNIIRPQFYATNTGSQESCPYINGVVHQWYTDNRNPEKQLIQDCLVDSENPPHCVKTNGYYNCKDVRIRQCDPIDNLCD